MGPQSPPRPTSFVWTVGAESYWCSPDVHRATGGRGCHEAANRCTCYHSRNCSVPRLTGGGEQEAAVHESGISFVQAAAGGPSVTEAEHEVQEARAVEERAEQSVNAAQRRIKSKKKAAASQAKSLKKKMKAQKKKMKKVLKAKMKKIKAQA